MTAFLTTVFAICGAYMLLNFKHDIHMLQQNSYRLDRYWRYLKKDDISSAWRLFDIAFLFLLFSPRLDLRLTLLLITLMALYKSVALLRRKFKKPLVFTNRVKRIYGVTALLAGGSYVALALCIGFRESVVAGYQGAQLTMGWLLLLTSCSWAVVMAAVVLLKPVEKHINDRFRNETSEILRSMTGLTVIGITGSYGKTSTKHFLKRILDEKFDVLMTPGSYNTPMGVIRTVREMMKPYHTVFICEMGAKQKGDVKEICDLVHPDMGIITAVGPMHLESFKTMENVQATKFELADALPEGGFLAVNNDFEYCAGRPVGNVETARYTLKENAGSGIAYKVTDIVYSQGGTEFRITGPDGLDARFETPLVGSGNISNLTGAVIIALRLGMEVRDIQRAVSHMEQVEHRLSMKQTPGGVTVIDDAFNSNPQGAKMALEVLKGFKGGRRIVVTPGMIELGDRQEELNREFGKEMARACDTAIVVGEYNRNALAEGLREGGMPEDSIHPAADFNAAQAILGSVLKPGDTVLYENDLPDSFK